MRAVSKADYGKGGNIPSYEVLKVVTNGGEFNPDEMYFHDYDEDTEYLCWEERRYEIAKTVSPKMLDWLTASGTINSEAIEDNRAVRNAVFFADSLIAELQRVPTQETKQE